MSGARVVDQKHLGRALHGIATGRTHPVKAQRRLVPVIFLPGIMGSRLAAAAGGADPKRWDPDDTKFMASKFLSFAGSYPREKKELLVGRGTHQNDYLRPHTDDAVHNRVVGLSPVEVARGWGGVFWGSYGTFLRALVGQLAEISPVVGTLPAPGTAGGRRPARMEEMPVFAFPYNWTASCAVSGQRLADQIPAIIAQARRELGEPDLTCPGVLLITHSMGGLVGRAACRIGGAQGRVLGVIHGVQPAVGAAAAYWRMKAGFPRTPGLAAVKQNLQAMSLGKDGREVTALLGNMPGGLELLPSTDYRAPDGATAWLHWPMPDGATAAVPRGNPYAEIYRSADAAWRLVPDARWLDMRRPVATPPTRVPGRGPGRFGAPAEAADPTWVAYLRRVSAVEAFHRQLSGYQHPVSCHFWGTGGAVTPGSVSFAAVQTRPATLDDPNYSVLYGARPGDTSEEALPNWTARQACGVLNMQQANWGEYTFYQPITRNGRTDYPLGPGMKVWQCVLRPARDQGDGTVPTFSGAILGRGRDPDMAVAFAGVDHEGVYREALVQRRVGLMTRRVLAIASNARR